ncbi:MAG TPA: right-handed parallel beta-helix repeat-containing protein, partial [Chthoniobacterales bacterium]|nr:right-handed parallel beta-helix repeat-containing protein [Chthoniobacterales bacterium]
MVFLMAASIASEAAAATRTVTNLNDNGPGSLRQTLAAAQDGDTIDFAVTGTIILTSSELAIGGRNVGGRKDLTIQGPGAKLLAVSGNNERRVMNIGFDARVTVSGLTIRDGFDDTRGGGIFSSGMLTLRECMIVNNRDSGVANGETGTMQIDRCTIAGNLVTNRPGGNANGGGIDNDGALSISNSTVADNEARIDLLNNPNRISGGGGIYNNGRLPDISGCTIAGNRVTGDGVGLRRGGGVLNDTTVPITMRDTIVAGNEASNRKDVEGAFTSGGYNIIGNLAADGDTRPPDFRHGVNRDQVGGFGRPVIDARLGPVGDNGGSTFTKALLSGSPAIDQGLSSLATDQRGAARRSDLPRVANAEGGDGSDVGAFELSATPSTLQNISTRAQVQQNDNVLIGGFIVSGSDAKKVLLRAIGPSLSREGVQGALQNPTLELFQGSERIANNDDWKQSQQAEIEATGIPPTNDAESAIVRTLTTGSYTAIVRGVNNETGIALVEAYDLDQSAKSALDNISTRAFVQTDEKVLIGGIIVGPAGSVGSRVLVRALGPSLAGSGVSGPLQDP